MVMHLQPRLSLVVGHRKDTIVALFAVMHDRPRNRATKKNEGEGRDLRAATALHERDDETDDAHRQSVNRQWVDQDVNVFGLTEILAECGEHEVIEQWVME